MLLLVALRLVSLWMCSKRAAGNVKSPNGVTVHHETLERWYDWQAHAQLRQSFCTLITQNVLRPSSLLLLSLDATGQKRTGTLGVVVCLEHTADVSWQGCRSI
jgi:hypothetical protein